MANSADPDQLASSEKTGYIRRGSAGLGLIRCWFFFFNPKVMQFFLFLHKNIYCGYSLEAPQLISTHNICFRGEVRKMFTWYPLLSRPMNMHKATYVPGTTHI